MSTVSTTIAGPPERLIEQLHEVVGSGARNLIKSQFVDDELGFMDLLGREILPALRSERSRKGKGEEVKVEIESGEDRLEAVRVVPNEGTHPGVIVVHVGGGFGEHAVGVADELAAAGHAALAVNRYRRGGPAPDITNPDLPPSPACAIDW